jgi:glucokinase
MSKQFSIGVDLGGTNLRVASYASGTEFLESIQMPTRLSAGREEVVRDMCEAIQSLVRRNYGGRKLAGVAVASPGPLELPRGILRNPPNLPGWDGFSLRDAISQILRYDILIESDANAAALAEQRLGAGKKYNVQSLCVLTLGTGVGNGLIFNNQIWSGTNGMGGEAGHIIVSNDEEAVCGCGGFGCLEQYASASAISRMAREQFGASAPESAKELAILAHGGNPLARGIFESLGIALAIALTGLINTLNLPLYLLGGGVCDAWDLFSPQMFHELERRSYVYRLTKPDCPNPAFLEPNKTYILPAELGSSAGLLGACLLGLEYKPAAYSSGSSKEDMLVH